MSQIFVWSGNTRSSLQALAPAGISAAQPTASPTSLHEQALVVVLGRAPTQEERRTLDAGASIEIPR